MLKKVPLTISQAIDLIPYPCPSPYDLFKQFYDGGLNWVAYVDENNYMTDMKLEKKNETY